MSQVLGPEERQRHLLFLGNAALWPAWPFLPVVRRTGEGDFDHDCGLLCDLQEALGLTGYRYSVFACNLLQVPANWNEFLALPRETFGSPEAVLAAGWRVD